MFAITVIRKTDYLDFLSSGRKKPPRTDDQNLQDESFCDADTHLRSSCREEASTELPTPHDTLQESSTQRPTLQNPHEL